MISLGLIGYPLAHSLSPQLHAAALRECGLQGEYRLFPVPPEDKTGLARLTEQVRNGEILGLNVTIPYKQSVMEFLDDLSPAAKSIGAVNTIVWKNKKLVGDNTDAPGFLSDLGKAVPAGFPARNALVLGAGGAARAVVYGLLKEGWSVTLAIRGADAGQAAQLISTLAVPGEAKIGSPVLLEARELEPCLEKVGLVVNATPLGMYPEIDCSAWPNGLPLPRGALIYDLVYNPRQTALIRQARQEGLPTASGIGMLVEQAALSFEIWTGRRPPREAMFSVVEAA